MNDESRRAEPSDPQVAAALRDYLERIDRGEQVDPEDFLARRAHIADQLRSFIATEDEVRKLAGIETSLDSTKSFDGHGQETIAPQSGAIRNDESGGSGLTGQFGRYRIIGALGRGAMGTVYLAEDTQLDRQVALKTPHFNDDLTGEQLERFYREARAAATLRHPDICPVYDVGQIEGKHFISMAYIDGRPLAAFIQPDRLQSERQILMVIRKLAQGLQEAHERGIVHRDLKPANIMIDHRSEPVIMDFGLARLLQREGDTRLTQSGVLVGTPAYMSPEQVEGDPGLIGPATDQYSLGVILYEMLTGQLPFRGPMTAVIGQIVGKEAAPPSTLRPDLDPRIEDACRKMMAKNPANRFGSLAGVADELRSILKNFASKPNASIQSASKSPESKLVAADRGALGDVRSSRILKSQHPKPLTASDLVSLEELARKCLARRDYDQVIQLIERIPGERQTAEAQLLLEKAREKSDAISYLLVEIDEADRLNDARTALGKAEELLKIKPGHYRSREIQEKYSGPAADRPARLASTGGLVDRWNEGGWIPWGVLAFGAAVFALVLAIVIYYVRGTAVIVDIRDPGVSVIVDDDNLHLISRPGNEKVTVQPGEHELFITHRGVTFTTEKFSLKQGNRITVEVSVVDSKTVAKIGDKLLRLTARGPQELAAGRDPGRTPRPREPSETANGNRRELPGDRERQAARAMSALGALLTIHVDGQDRRIERGKSLPNEPFVLTAIEITANSKVTDSDFLCLERLSQLQHFTLTGAPRVTGGLLSYLRTSTQLESITLGDCAIADVGLADLKSLTHLKRLSLTDVPISDAGLANLEPLQSLEFLSLAGTRITDGGLIHLRGLTRLTGLVLARSAVGGEGLVHLKGLSNLRSLRLYQARVTDAGLVSLQGLTKIELLQAGSGKVTDAGAAALLQFTNLQELGLSGSRITDAGLSRLTGLRKLKTLGISFNPITDAGIASLKHLERLERLRISHTRVSNAAVPTLKSLTNLKELEIVDTRIDTAGVEQLRQSLPGCKIVDKP